MRPCNFFQWGSEKSVRDAFYRALFGGIRSTVEMLAALFKPLYKNFSLLSHLLYLRDFHLNFSSILVILPVSNQ